MAISKSSLRIIDLFREWDQDGDGIVTKQEFRNAMPNIGLDVPPETIDALFDSLDPDLSGQLDYKEMSKALRPTVSACVCMCMYVYTDLYNCTPAHLHAGGDERTDAADGRREEAREGEEAATEEAVGSLGAER